MIGQTTRGHMLGILRIEMKHVNHKTCVHQINEIGPMKWVRVQSHAVMSVWGCIVVDWRCRGSKGKGEIGAYLMRRIITAELWEILPEFTNATAPYWKFVNTVCQQYPGSDVEQCWLIADMDRLVEETLRTGISLPSPHSLSWKTALPPQSKVAPSPVASRQSFGAKLATDSSSNFPITSPMTQHLQLGIVEPFSPWTAPYMSS